MHALAGVKVPQGLARLRVHGFEGLGIIAEKEKAAGCSHRSTGGMSRTYLGISPDGFVRFEAVGEQDLLAMIAGAVPDAGGIIRLSFGEFLRFQKIEIAVLFRQEIEKIGRGVIRR